MGKEVKLDEEAAKVTGSCETTLDEASLIDVTDVAAKAGFVYPVFISRSLYERCLTIRSKAGNETEWDSLWMFFFSLQRHANEGPELYKNEWPCTFIMNEGWYLGPIKVVRRGDVEADWTLTFMLPED
jgi:hypothetical protein